MSDMIERVARAMHHAECQPHREHTGYGDTWQWEDAMPAVRERHLAAARAAIEAMREPTEEMVESVRDHDNYWGYYADGRPSGPDNCWRGMIDTALSEGTQT